MEVQLRPARSRIHPLVRPASRRFGGGIGYTQPPDCTPKTPGAIPDPACITQLLAVQQANMAEHDEQQRQIFLDNCNRDWATNDAQYAALGQPRPANQCDQIYPVGGRGAADPVQLAPVYLPPPTPAPAPVIVHPPPTTVTAQPAQTVTPDIGTPPAAPQSGSSTGQALYLLEQPSAGGFPLWIVLVGAGAVLYFMTRGR